MKNIKKFIELLGFINESIKELAVLYYEDLQNNKKAEDQYAINTSVTRTALRKLVAIAKEDMIPESFFITSCTAYNMLSTMRTDQQETCLNSTVVIYSEDNSHRLKKFEDLSPRQMNMFYCLRSKSFRNLAEQKEWINDNPVVKLSHKGELKQPEVKPKTKAALIKELKLLGINEKDLSKLADASTLMKAAQLALVS